MKKTYVALVLDRSGSMSSIKNETISSFNEQFDVIKRESKDIETVVSLTTFNDTVEYKFFNKPVDEIVKLTENDYDPCGLTAMYDAIGGTIVKMENELKDLNDPETTVLFIVLTDGLENVSRDFTSYDVSNVITRLNKTGRWTFSVIGANINLNDLANTLKIAQSNMLKISGNADGIARSVKETSTAYSTYFNLRRKGSKNLDTKFYSEEEKVKDTTEN